MAGSSYIWLLSNMRESALNLEVLLQDIPCRIEWVESEASFHGATSDVVVSAADALEDIRWARKRTDAWLVAFQREGQEDTELAVLEAGADAYIRFSREPVLLQARFLSLLRGLSRLQKEGVFRLGALRIDFSARCVFLDGDPIGLTPTEYRLVFLLASHAGQYLTYEHLCRECGVAMPALRVHMTSLRKKLKTDCIFNHAGIGYKMPREIRQ